MLITLGPSLPIAKNEPVSKLHPEIAIDLPNDDMYLADILDYLVKPALMAWGFGEEQLDAVIRPEFYTKTEHVNCPQCGYLPKHEIITGSRLDDKPPEQTSD